MTAVRMSVAGLLAWMAVASLAQADPISSSSALTQWESWVPAGGATDAGFTPATPDPAPAPPPPPAPITSAAANNPAPAPVAIAPPPPSAPSPSPSSGAPFDAYLNFSSGPYAEANGLVTGTPQAWYQSPSVQQVFGGVPNAQQQAAFTQQVFQDVQKTFALSGLNPQLTVDPNAPANHTLSVVSGASYGPNPNAIGITDVGGSGFGFIDKLSYATSVNDLEWAVAHNISHELMHAFGVAVHHDQTGNYIDAATASWPLLTSPDATFSPAAAQDILAHAYGRNTSSPSSVNGNQLIDGDQEILAQPVPEPATITFWVLAGTMVVYRHRRSSGRHAA